MLQGMTVLAGTPDAVAAARLFVGANVSDGLGQQLQAGRGEDHDQQSARWVTS